MTTTASKYSFTFIGQYYGVPPSIMLVHAVS
jgi:hypothetical protein